MTRRTIWINFLLYPAHTLPTAAAPVVVGVGLAIHDHVFAPHAALLGFLASWFIHLGGVFMDNTRLLARHADLREHPEMTDALARGLITLPGLRQATILCFVLAALSGATLVSAVGVVAPALGLIGTVASLGYCVSRFAWTRLGIADVVFFLMFGVVAVAGIYYVQAAPYHGTAGGWRFLPAALPLPAWVLGLPVGAIVTNVLLIDDMRDREFDALKGWRTRPVVHGLRWTQAEFAGLMALAYLLPFWFWRGLGFDAWILLPLATLPRAVWITRRVCGRPPVHLGPMTPKTAMLGLAYAVLLAVGTIASR